MFAGIPHVPPPRPSFKPRTIPLSDVAWKATWPFWLSSIVACLMLLFTMTIGALEIASLSKIIENSLFGNTSSTGAGLWCGLFMLITAVFIFLINYMRRTRLWATIALIATIIAACFSAIIIGLDAKAVSDGRKFQDAYGSFYVKSKILAAQLAFSIAEFLLCMVFIIIYIVVALLASSRLRRPALRRY